MNLGQLEGFTCHYIQEVTVGIAEAGLVGKNTFRLEFNCLDSMFGDFTCSISRFVGGVSFSN